MSCKVWSCLLTALFLFAATPSWGQVTVVMPLGEDEPAPPDQPELYKLVLSPAPEPRPALRYELLPSYQERTPGNAAPYYYRALLSSAQLPKEHNQKYQENHRQWSEGPLAEMPKAEMKAWVAGYARTLEDLKIAAHREQCDWDLRIHELKGLDVISFLLHDFQEMRRLARVLQAKARLEIAAGKLDEARETLRLGYQLARDTAAPPLLINSLIGISIASLMNQQLLELMAAPESPNMYWALAALPEPLIDLRPALRQEMQMPLQMFPFLKDAETAERTPEEWRAIILAAINQLSRLETNSSLPREPDWTTQLAATALLIKYYPLAKQSLIAGGMSREKVEAMPVGQVVAIHSARSYQYAYHEMFKWSLLPYHEAWRRMADAEQRLIREGYLGPSYIASSQMLHIASLLMPATRVALSAPARLESHLAGLRVIEALRMHAAANGRRLPRSLEDITIVPVPVDPTTGKPFLYRLDGDKATLEIPAPQDQPIRVGKRYEITLAPPPDSK